MPQRKGKGYASQIFMSLGGEGEREIEREMEREEGREKEGEEEEE